jgi:hypothetical protein
MPASAEATALANTAVQHDRAGNRAEAIRAYRQAADALVLDAERTGDASVFTLAKVNEYRARAIELETALAREATSSSSTQAIDALHAAEAEVKRGGGARVVAGAAVVGGAVGAACLGPLSAVAAAGAMAYGTTRTDSIGSVTRGAGKAAANAFSSLRRWNKDYKVTTKLAEAATTTAKAVKKVDNDYGITSKAASAVKTSAKAASEFNEKHKVTAKIGQGVSSGLDKITTTMSSKAGDAPSAPPAQR